MRVHTHTHTASLSLSHTYACTCTAGWSKRIAVSLTFVLSAVIHVIGVAAAGARGVDCVMVGLFFLAQCVTLALESMLTMNHIQNLHPMREIVRFLCSHAKLTGINCCVIVCFYLCRGHRQWPRVHVGFIVAHNATGGRAYGVTGISLTGHAVDKHGMENTRMPKRYIDVYLLYKLTNTYTISRKIPVAVELILEQ